MENKEDARIQEILRIQEVLDKILSVIKEYKMTYREVMELRFRLKCAIRDTVISEDSLKPNHSHQD